MTPIPTVGARARWHDHAIISFIGHEPRVYDAVGRRAENEAAILRRLCMVWGLADHCYRASVRP